MGMPPAVEKKVHRQAAAAVGKLLEADEEKRGGANIKTLTLAPANIAKKATYALTCETLRCTEPFLLFSFCILRSWFI
jgi:hypothetical protein